MAVNGTETGAFGGSSLFGPIQNAATTPPPTVNVPSFLESVNHARNVNQAPIATGWGLPPSASAFYQSGVKNLIGGIGGWIWKGPDFSLYPQGALFAPSQNDGTSLEPGLVGLPWFVFPQELLPVEDPFRMLMGPGYARVPASPNIPVTDDFFWQSGFGSGNLFIERWNQIMFPGNYDCSIQVFSDISGSPVPNYTTVNLEIVSISGLYRADVTPGNIDLSASFAGAGNNIPFSFTSSQYFAGGFYPQVRIGNMPDPESITPLPGSVTWPTDGTPFTYFNFRAQWNGNKV